MSSPPPGFLQASKSPNDPQIHNQRHATRRSQERTLLLAVVLAPPPLPDPHTAPPPLAPGEEDAPVAVAPDPGLVQARLPAEDGAQPRPHEARAAAGRGAAGWGAGRPGQRREGAAAPGPLDVGLRSGRRGRARLGRRLALHLLLLLLLLWRYGTRAPMFLVYSGSLAISYFIVKGASHFSWNQSGLHQAFYE
jgi:hypothetical protein